MNISQRIQAAPPSTREFIDEYASLLSPWGVPAAAGRLYAYLLLSNEPVSLEQIAADLDMSKAGAWNTARFLEQSGNLRRSTERGSKRVFFRLINDIAPCMLDQIRAFGEMGRLVAAMMPEVAEAKTQERLARMAKFCFSVGQLMSELTEQYDTAKALNTVTDKE